MFEIIIAVVAFSAGYFLRPQVDKYRADKRASALGGGGPPPTTPK